MKPYVECKKKEYTPASITMFTAEVWNGTAAWSFHFWMLFSPHWFACCVWLWDCAGQRRGLVVRQRVSGLFALSCGIVRKMCAWDPKLASFACILTELYHPLAVFRCLYQLVDLTEECVHQKLMSVCGAHICLLLQQHIHCACMHTEKRTKTEEEKLVKMSLVHSLDKTYFLRLSRSLVCFCFWELPLKYTLRGAGTVWVQHWKMLWLQSVHIVAPLITLAMRRWDWGYP